MKLNEVKCPNCGARINNIEKETLTCEYCNTTFSNEYYQKKNKILESKKIIKNVGIAFGTYSIITFVVPMIIITIIITIGGFFVFRNIQIENKSFIYQALIASTKHTQERILNFL